MYTSALFHYKMHNFLTPDPTIFSWINGSTFSRRCSCTTVAMPCHAARQCMRAYLRAAAGVSGRSRTTRGRAPAVLYVVWRTVYYDRCEFMACKLPLCACRSGSIYSSRCGGRRERLQRCAAPCMCAGVGPCLGLGGRGVNSGGPGTRSCRILALVWMEE